MSANSDGICQLCPDTDTSKEPVEAQHTDRDASVHTPASDRSRSTIDRAGPVSLSALTPQTPDGSDGYRSSDDDEVYKGVVHEFRKLSVTRQMYRYHGKSSGWVFIRSAIDLKDQYATDSPKGLNRTDRREPVSAASCSLDQHRCDIYRAICSVDETDFGRRFHAVVHRLPSR